MLERAASSAATAAVEANAQISKRLDICLAEERIQASVNRQNLLSQITTLINQSGELGDARWESKFNSARNELASTALDLQAANDNYNKNMDIWSQKETLLIDKITMSRDMLKQKMKQDWTVSILFGRHE